MRFSLISIATAALFLLQTTTAAPVPVPERPFDKRDATDLNVMKRDANPAPGPVPSAVEYLMMVRGEYSRGRSAAIGA